SPVCAEREKTHVRHLAAPCARVLSQISCPLNAEGAGNAGRSVRTQPGAQQKKRTSLVATVTPGSPGHSPRNGFNGYFVLSPATGSFATVIGGISSANLTPASGRQDHTTSPSAGPRSRLQRNPRP